nr:hypothetical protein [Tanacetum cinerariifolium]
MTISVVNNSVFNVDYKLNYLEHPIPAAPVPAHAGQQVPTEAFAAYVAWVKGEKETVGLILMTMKPNIQHNMENLGAYDMLQELKTLFFQQVEQELLQTVREFHACKHEDQSVSSYVFKMKIYIENLECLDHPVLLNLAVSLILVSLRKEYDRFVQNYNMHGMRKMVNEFHAMLKLHEQSLPKNDARALHAIRAGKVQKKIYKNKNSQLAAMGNNQGKWKSKLDYAPKPKIPPSPKNKNLAKDSVCHQCGDIGQWKREQLYSFLGKYWAYDTGCGTHIYNTTQGLRGSSKLKPGALSLYMGNDQRITVEAIGSFHLCFPSGLVVIFHNFQYAPSITRGIISVSCLDCIYEIDSSNSNSNNSSMYAVTNKRGNLNLESTLLWHYRLGHISKKCIEKLQHDGLLNSTDNQCFAMKDLGEAAYILRIKIYRDRSRRLICLYQSAYIEKILKRFFIENSKRGSIPMQKKPKLCESKGASTPAENMTSQFQHNPGELHWTVVKNILKYLRNTKDMFFVYEAEYIVASDASKEAVWVKKFIYGLGVVPTIEEPIKMYYDNTEAITIANESGVTKGA